MKDLVILAADKDLEFALRGMLSRPEALGIRPVEANTDIFVEPEHDPACALRGVDFLDNLSGQYRYGLLIFDHKGSGKEATVPQELQKSLNAEFVSSTWGRTSQSNRAVAGVRDMDLERLSAHRRGSRMEKTAILSFDPWLIEQDYLQEGEAKPAWPKEAFRSSLTGSTKTSQCILISADCEKGLPASMYGYSVPRTQRYSEQLVSRPRDKRMAESRQKQPSASCTALAGAISRDSRREIRMSRGL